MVLRGSVFLMSEVPLYPSTRNKKTAYLECWIVTFVPVTRTVSSMSLRPVTNRLLTPENGRSRGNFKNKRVLGCAPIWPKVVRLCSVCHAW